MMASAQAQVLQVRKLLEGRETGRGQHRAVTHVQVGDPWAPLTQDLHVVVGEALPVAADVELCDRLWHPSHRHSHVGPSKPTPRHIHLLQPGAAGQHVVQGVWAKPGAAGHVESEQILALAHGPEHGVGELQPLQAEADEPVAATQQLQQRVGVVMQWDRSMCCSSNGLSLVKPGSPRKERGERRTITPDASTRPRVPAGRVAELRSTLYHRAWSHASLCQRRLTCDTFSK